MEFAIWDLLLEIVVWSIRLLFWPLGLMIKHRHVVATVFPYLALGVVALVVGTAALGVLGTVIQWVFVIGRGIYRLFASIISLCRPSVKEQAQRAGGVDAAPTPDPNDPYQVLGVNRDVTEHELTARYKELLRANHPDKVAQLDPAIQALATQRSRRIIEAYQWLRNNDRRMSA